MAEIVRKVLTDLIELLIVLRVIDVDSACCVRYVCSDLVQQIRFMHMEFS